MVDTYPIFVSLDGTAMEGGQVYIGAVNGDPETQPIAVYWDAALTIPAAQPVRTSGGVLVRDGTPTQLYAGQQSYSLRVRDRSGQVVWYKPITGGTVEATRLTFPIPGGPIGPRGDPGPPGGTAGSMAQLKVLAASLSNGDACYLAADRIGGWFKVRDGQPPVADPFEAVYAVVNAGRYVARVGQRGSYMADWWNLTPDGQQSTDHTAVTGTDNTAAIQAILTFMNVMGGGACGFSDGMYAVKGVQRMSANGLTGGQILWPVRSQADGAASFLLYALTPPAPYDSTVGGLSVQNTGVIFVSDTNSGPIFGGGGNVYGQTIVKACARGLTARLLPASGGSGFDFLYTSWMEYDDLRVDVGTPTQSIPAPLEFSSNQALRTFGIRHPITGNGNQSRARGVNTATGFYRGWWFGEHDVYDNLIAFGCKYAALFVDNNYPVKGQYLNYSNCPYGLQAISINGGTCNADLDMVTSERMNPTYSPQMPAWMTPVADIVDLGNNLRGRMTLHPTLGGVAGPHPGPDDIVIQGGRGDFDIRRSQRTTRTAQFTASAGQTVPNQAWTPLNWNNVATSEPLVGIISTTNQSALVPRSNGSFSIQASVQFPPNGTGTARALRVVKYTNGNTYVLNEQLEAPRTGPNLAGTPPTIVNISVSDTLTNVGTDGYYVIQALQDSGGDLAIVKTGSPDVSSPTLSLTRAS